MNNAIVSSFSRRKMLTATASGLGALMLQAMGCRSDVSPLGESNRPRAAKAKRVIFLFMSGGPPQADTFDYKPQALAEEHGGSAFPFRQHGDCGHWISDLLPQTARHADKLCVINSMRTDAGDHVQARSQLHTGDRLRPQPSLGAWVNYGLGQVNDDLPGFISLNPGEPSSYSSAFLPAAVAGTPIGVNAENMSTASITNIDRHETEDAQRRQLDLTQWLNEDYMDRTGHDARLEDENQSLELAFRMQSAVPQVLDLTTESAKTLERYKVGKTEKVGVCRDTDFGRQCLLARRFAEAGVRFIEVNHGSWDQHLHHREYVTANCAATDAPIAALLEDLDDHGMLDDTLVVWGGEFGRTTLFPTQPQDGTAHNPKAFTFWLAGAGVKPGYVHGKTDETGTQVVADPVHVRDLHATILYLLGLAPNELSASHLGRDIRLTGKVGGRVVREILS